MMILLPIMNQIELLLSRLDDAINTLSLNPIGISAGQRITESIPKDMVGTTINLEDGGEFTASLARVSRLGL